MKYTERTRREIQMTREEMVGAVLVDPALYPAVEPYMRGCEDSELSSVFAAIGTLRQEGYDGTLKPKHVVQFGLPPARLYELTEHVRTADSDWPPSRFVGYHTARMPALTHKLVQIQMLEAENAALRKTIAEMEASPR